MQKAPELAERVDQLPDGRVRYYLPETAARTPGPTRGASYVTEYNPQTGSVRSWMESYDHSGNVMRIHPKMLNGQSVISPHFPPTSNDFQLFEDLEAEDSFYRSMSMR